LPGEQCSPRRGGPQAAFTTGLKLIAAVGMPGPWPGTVASAFQAKDPAKMVTVITVSATANLCIRLPPSCQSPKDSLTHSKYVDICPPANRRLAKLLILRLLSAGFDAQTY